MIYQTFELFLLFCPCLILFFMVWLMWFFQQSQPYVNKQQRCSKRLKIIHKLENDPVFINELLKTALIENDLCTFDVLLNRMMSITQQTKQEVIEQINFTFSDLLVHRSYSSIRYLLKQGPEYITFLDSTCPDEKDILDKTIASFDAVALLIVLQNCPEKINHLNMNNWTTPLGFLFLSEIQFKQRPIFEQLTHLLLDHGATLLEVGNHDLNLVDASDNKIFISNALKLRLDQQLDNSSKNLIPYFITTL